MRMSKNTRERAKTPIEYAKNKGNLPTPDSARGQHRKVFKFDSTDD